MEHLNEHGFSDAIRSAVAEGKPYLGMCLGLQVLFRESEESPGAEGLGILPGTVKRFQRPAEYKIPQIGWNGVRQVKPECALFKSIDDGAFFYFVHSYYVEPSDPDLVAGVTDYGGEYCSAVWKDNVMAVQFHPEKSQKDGLQMLRNFGSLFGGEGAV
jgi:glutamine amidotransferase